MNPFICIWFFTWASLFYSA